MYMWKYSRHYDSNKTGGEKANERDFSIILKENSWFKSDVSIEWHEIVGYLIFLKNQNNNK